MFSPQEIAKEFLFLNEKRLIFFFRQKHGGGLSQTTPLPLMLGMEGSLYTPNKCYAPQHVASKSSFLERKAPRGQLRGPVIIAWCVFSELDLSRSGSLTLPTSGSF